VDLLALPVGGYPDLLDTNRDQRLDFDDAYQYCIAEHYGLKIATLDRDFERSEGVIIKRKDRTAARGVGAGRIDQVAALIQQK
jgi:hypothetical protein